MAASIKPLILWGGVMGPNPGKVAMILEELSIPFEAKYIPYSEVKGKTYVDVNPNGRLPTLEDPNTGFKIWESGAIIEYLIEKYDPEYKLSFRAGTEEYYLCKQWLHFQMSGQGPYYGQAYWFSNLHPEKLQSAIDRYVNEIKRVTKVLDTHLADKEFLVGGKCTYADIAFLTWQDGASKQIDIATEFPHVGAWMNKMNARTGVKKVMDERAERAAAAAAAIAGKH